MVRCHAHHATLVHVAGAAHATLMVLLTALATVVAVVVLLLLLLLMVVAATAATAIVILVVMLLLMVVMVIAAEVAVVVLLSESVTNVQLALLEDELLLFDAQHLGRVILALVGDETVSFRVASRVRYDARILNGTKVSKVVS